MKVTLILMSVFCWQLSVGQLVSEYPPYLPTNFGGLPLNAGRCHAIAVHPSNRNIIIVSQQFGGLWKSTDGGNTWRHLNNLNAVWTSDVCFGPDGNTVVCTRNVDNAVDNGGGIWISRDGGETWSRPSTGRVPVFAGRTGSRGAAFGISYDPDSTGKIFVGTSSGIAISGNNGSTWRHAMLENTSRVNWQDSLQNQVLSVQAYGGNVAFACTRTGIYKTSNGGISWTNIRMGDFTFGGSFKLMDVWTNLSSSGGSYGVFILQDYNTLLLYENYYNRWTTVPLPGGQSRAPFVRVSRAATSGYQSVWVGTGVFLRKITKKRLGSFRPGLVTATSWLSLQRGEGLHDDSGFMGLDGSRRIVMYGSDGGLFKPLNDAGTRWTNACTRGSGMNSYQITDLAITNYSGSFGLFNMPEQSSLYFSTQDNGLWASGDRGVNWPNSECAEGFHIEVKDRADYFTTAVQVAYGKIGCGPSGNMFSDALFTNQRAVPNVNTSGVSLVDSIVGQAFLIGGNRYFRFRAPVGGNLEGLVSNNNGSNWRRRYVYTGISPAGVLHRARIGADGPERCWLPFMVNGDLNPDGSGRVGLVLHAYPFRSGTATYNASSIKQLPNRGSLGVRATEFDWQAVFGVNPVDHRHILAPDIVNGVVKVSRDEGNTWTTDEQLSNLVTRNGATKMWNGGGYNMQVTHISWDPYHTNRIMVGTRDNGVILSDDGGANWRRIRDSQHMTYITGFVFQPDNIVYVSTYGRGIWKIDCNVFVSSPSEFYFCRSCVFLDRSFNRIRLSDLSNYTVMETRGGEITGFGFDKLKKPQISISEKAFYKAWVPGKGQAILPAIMRSKEASVDKNLQKAKKAGGGMAVTGLVLKGNTLVAYMLQKQPLPYEKTDYAEKDYPLPDENTHHDKDEGEEEKEEKPVASIAARYNMNGLPLLKKGDELIVIINDAKAIITDGPFIIDGNEVDKKSQSEIQKGEAGYFIRIKLPDSLATGMHRLYIPGKTHENLTLVFMISNMDEFEKNAPGKRRPIPVKEVITD